MRELLFTPEFHLAVLAVFSFIICLTVTAAKIIKNTKAIERLHKLKDKEKWKEISAKVEDKGYFIHYSYPNSYTRDYGQLSELQRMKASSFEFESYKNRLKKQKIEKENGFVTIYYRTEDNKLRNRISVSRNPKVNYEYLISNKEKSVAYQNKANPRLVVLKIPDKQEIALEKRRATLDSIKSITGYVALSSIFCITALSI